MSSLQANPARPEPEECAPVGRRCEEAQQDLHIERNGYPQLAQVEYVFLPGGDGPGGLQSEGGKRDHDEEPTRIRNALAAAGSSSREVRRASSSSPYSDDTANDGPANEENTSSARGVPYRGVCLHGSSGE